MHSSALKCLKRHVTAAPETANCWPPLGDMTDISPLGFHVESLFPVRSVCLHLTFQQKCGAPLTSPSWRGSDKATAPASILWVLRSSTPQNTTRGSVPGELGGRFSSYLMYNLIWRWGSPSENYFKLEYSVLCCLLLILIILQ